jgi:hypothetical protein
MLLRSRANVVTRYIAKVRRYNELGAEGLKDKRHQHRGCQPLLPQAEQAQMKQNLPKIWVKAPSF